MSPIKPLLSAGPKNVLIMPLGRNNLNDKCWCESPFSFNSLSNICEVFIDSKVTSKSKRIRRLYSRALEALMNGDLMDSILINFLKGSLYPGCGSSVDVCAGLRRGRTYFLNVILVEELCRPVLVGDGRGI